MRIAGSIPRPTRVDQLMSSRLMARLDRLDVRTRKMFPGKLQGERRSKKRGQSVEFDDFRAYVRGDDPRFIDWNVFARMDRLVIKLFLEEEDLAVHLAIDASGSMRAGEGDANKMLFAARVAMALGYIGLVQQNRVAVSIFGLPASVHPQGLARLPDVRGRHNVQRVGAFIIETMFGDAMAQVAAGGGGAGAAGGAAMPAPGGSFSDALTTIARTRVGKGVMFILSDFLAPEGYEPGLSALAAAGGYDTCCLQVLAPAEIDPARGGDDVIAGDVRLTDVETGRAAEVTVTPQVLKRYREKLEAYGEQLRRYCVAREMAHVLVPSDTKPEELIFDTLRRRGMLA